MHFMGKFDRLHPMHSTLQPTPGRFIMDFGQFRARLRKDAKTGDPRYLEVSFRIIGDPSNYNGLEYYKEATGLGRTWVSPNTAGWSIADLSEQLELFDNTSGRGLPPQAQHHARWPVVAAWRECLDLVPKRRRTLDMQAGKRYRPRDYVEAKQEAVNRLLSVSRKYPPEAKMLPRNFI